MSVTGDGTDACPYSGFSRSPGGIIAFITCLGHNSRLASDFWEQLAAVDKCLTLLFFISLSPSLSLDIVQIAHLITACALYLVRC